MHFIILLWLTPDNFAGQRDEPSSKQVNLITKIIEKLKMKNKATKKKQLQHSIQPNSLVAQITV